MSSSATFPLDVKTREFFLQTSEYRSESCYIMRCSHPAWMYVVSMLMERFSSVLSCSVGKRRRGDVFQGSRVVAGMK